MILSVLRFIFLFYVFTAAVGVTVALFLDRKLKMPAAALGVGAISVFWPYAFIYLPIKWKVQGVLSKRRRKMRRMRR